jgi:hypothetical protein
MGVHRLSLALLAVALCLSAQSFSPDDVKIVGDINYGETSAPVLCSSTPAYCAFVFNGRGDDRVEATVQADQGTALVAIADGSLSQLANGTTRVVFTLPNHGPDAEAYYIVFRDREHKAGRFAVALQRMEK